jgi:hypothetical protein
MDRDEMLRLFEAHREAEMARDIDGILDTFVPDPFLETMALGLRSEGRDAVRAAYEMQFFSAFPDLAPDDEGMALGDDTIVVWARSVLDQHGFWDWTIRVDISQPHQKCAELAFSAVEKEVHLVFSEPPKGLSGDSHHAGDRPSRCGHDRLRPR